ncbi:lytic polysaccharide monooxygenase [Poronia punctata]|nr:lytic polysaccharide monooxygenase [Poronia punctata]
MKFLLPTLALAITANAHSVFQKMTVNGADQGLLTGLRMPDNNNPVEDVQSSDITCGAPGYTSSIVIDVKAGDEIGAWYQHGRGGPQGSNDPDNPIASSHKGPVTAYLAAVSDAATASATSADWFKIYEDTFDTGSKRWGVDNLISNDGWVNFRLPSCIPSGDYLLRVEVLALHYASSQGGAQFYTSCAQIRVSDGGSTRPCSTIKLPGYYSDTGSDILINIYGATGEPDNNGRPYSHGPSKFTC